jgi:hypothetical protein
MSTNYSPKIVTDGLVMYLDVGNVKSYPGSGTNLSDISRNNNNGILTNGPVFSSANGGNLFFDGTDDFISVSSSTSLNPTGAISLCAFVNVSNVYANYGPIIFKQNNYTSSYEQYSLSISTAGRFGVTITGTDRAQKAVNSGVTDFRNTRSYVVGVISTITDDLKIYVNGNLLGVNSTFTSTFDTSNNNVVLGAMTTIYPGYINGRIFNASIYNRALSATEVLNNYNATKKRFGL